MMPRVSVVIPNYNHAAFLRQRLDTVFNKNLPPHEVIVLDDASTDDSLKIIEVYAEEMCQMRVCGDWLLIECA
jgi:glycosyltransferase involved in cell wall biosynthesis